MMTGALGAGFTTSVKSTLLAPPELVAVIVTGKVPVTVGVPVIVPSDALIGWKPAGKPVAVKAAVNGAPLKAGVKLNAVPCTALKAVDPVKAGAFSGGSMVIWRLPEPEPPALLAVMVTS